MKVLISGMGNPQNLGKMLEIYGIDVSYVDRTRPFIKGSFDIFLVFGVRPKNVLYALTGPGKKIWRFQGSDGFKPRPFIKLLMKIVGGNILYASNGLKREVGLKGEVLATPINTDLFNPVPGVKRDKEVLYYCPGGNEEIYQMDLCPEGATVLDGSIPYENMPEVYSRHQKYIRWTTHDANPKMPFEALLCGCEVWVNGEQIYEVPDFMLMEKVIPLWIKYLLSIQHSEVNRPLEETTND